MRRILLAATPIGLACALVGAPARAAPLPDRVQVQAALDAWLACSDPPEPSCRPPAHIVLSASRCWPDLGGPGREDRVVCLFSGLAAGGAEPATRIDGDCVYLRREAGVWRFVGFLDDDICAEYRTAPA